MRLAVIDLGTNTFNLLIGERTNGRIEFLYSTKWPVLLGMSGITKAIISSEALDRAKECLTDFKKKCNDWGVVNIKAFGTSALRGAENQDDFQKLIFSIIGATAEVITGKREAELIFKGVQACHSLKAPSLIMDIGGGSTEFIHTDLEFSMNDCMSLDIGVTRMYEMLGFPKEFEANHYNTIRKELELHQDKIKRFESDILIGCSGSFETFGEMILHKRVNDIKESIALDLKEFKKVIDWTLRSSHHDREMNEWIIPLRKRMLPISAAKVKWVLELFDPKELWLSPYSLKEGAFAEFEA